MTTHDDDRKQLAAEREREQYRRDLGASLLAGLRESEQRRQKQFGELLEAALEAKYGPIADDKEKNQ